MRGGNSGHVAREGSRDEFKIGVEVVGLEKPVFAVIVAVEIDPVHRAYRQDDFACGITGQRKASDHGVFETQAEGSVGAMKVAARKIFFEGRGADGDAIEFDFRPGRRAG